jgi:Ca2+-binding RTX toxin-like protein
MTADDGGGDDLFGGGGNDVLRGGGGNDVLRSAAAATTGCSAAAATTVLRGGGGNDVLRGGGGNDRLIGGAGTTGSSAGPATTGSSAAPARTSFVFQPNGGDDVVVDFQDDLDRLDFRAFNFANKASVLNLATQVGAGVVFALPGGATVELNNFDINLLGAEDIVI